MGTTNALGVSVTSTFDALGRRLERRIDGVVHATWSWDGALGGIGGLSQRDDDAGSYRVEAYDARGLATLETYRRPLSRAKRENPTHRLDAQLPPPPLPPSFFPLPPPSIFFTQP